MSSEGEQQQRDTGYIMFDTENVHRAQVVNDKEANYCFAISMVLTTRFGPEVNLLDKKETDRYVVDSLTVYPKWTGRRPDKSTLDWWRSDKNRKQYNVMDSQGRPIHECMQKVMNFYVKAKSKFKKVVFGAFPAAYDWQWLNELMIRVYPNVDVPSQWPFDAICVYTLYDSLKSRNHPELKKLKDDLAVVHGYNHDPLEDATRQAVMWMHILNLLDCDLPQKK